MNIIELAKQAGLRTYQEQAPGIDGIYGNWEDLENFAALVVANIDPKSLMSWQEGYEAGAAHEREACADIAENWNSNGFPRTGVANEIRARGTT